MKKILSLLVIAVAASAATIGAYEYLELGKKEVIIEKTQPESPFRYVDNTTPYSSAVADFTGAAEISTPAVVHIIATKVSSYNAYDPWRELFGDDFFWRST